LPLFARTASTRLAEEAMWAYPKVRKAIIFVCCSSVTHTRCFRWQIGIKESR
jgi:hypothetical protein